jgi:insertion element IS1 protein InsB
MVLEPIHCPDCDGTDVRKNGKSPEGKQRYCCRNPDCARHSFILDYTYQAYLPQIKQKVVDMTLRGSGIRDIAENLAISPTTVIEVLKKKNMSLNQ